MQLRALSLLFVLAISAHATLDFPTNRDSGSPVAAACSATPSSLDKIGDFATRLLGVWDGVGSMVFINATDGTVAESISMRTSWTVFYNAQYGRVDWITTRQVADGITFQDTYDAIYAQDAGRSCAVQLKSALGIGSDSVGLVDDSQGTITAFDIASHRITSVCRYFPVSASLVKVSCDLYDDQGQGYIPEGTFLTYQAIMNQKDSP